MSDASLYQRVIQTPSLDALSYAIYAGAVVIVAACLILAFTRWTWTARVLGIFGVLMILGSLYIFQEQTVVERVSSEVRVTRYKYPEAFRNELRVAITALSVSAVVVMATVAIATRRWLHSTVPYRLRRAEIFHYLKKYDEALGEFDKVLAIQPKRVEVYYQRGVVHDARASFDLALADFDQVLKLKPTHTMAFFRRGRVRLELGRCSEALADFQRVLDMRPNDPETLMYIGMCHFKTNNFEEAAVEFEKVLKLTNNTDFTEPTKDYLARISETLGLGPKDSGSGPSPQVASSTGTAGDAEVENLSVAAEPQ